jgi:3D (Asp-Asp-Asp) domain-containing protein
MGCNLPYPLVWTGEIGSPGYRTKSRMPRRRGVVRSPTLGGRRTRSAARLAGIGAVIALAAGSAAAAAGPGDRDRARASQLEVRAQALDSRAHRALLDLYSLDSQLSTAQQRAAALGRQAATMESRRRVLTADLTATRHTLVLARQALGTRLRTLYEQGRIDPVAVVLGSTSLARALARIDDASRVANESEQLAAVAGAAESRLRQASRKLSAQRRAVEASLAAADDAARTLSAARDSRAAYVSSLQADSRLAHAQVRTLVARATAVEAKAQQIQAAAASAPPATPSTTTGATTTATVPQVTPPPSTSQGRTLSVSSTGYSLKGHTATGLPVGWGIVAVDPSVIPLGTKLTIPGYGEGVAADVGSGVHGATIDLWFPTLAQARAWGRRTLTITLH